MEFDAINAALCRTFRRYAEVVNETVKIVKGLPALQENKG